MTKKLTESETLAVLEYVEVNGFGACAECPAFPCGNHCYRTITTNAINHMRAIRGETMCVTSRTAEERIQKLITQFNFEKDVMLKEMTRLANENFELKDSLKDTEREIKMIPNNRPLRIARAAIRFHKIDEPDNWQIMYGFNHAEVFRQMKDLGIIYDKKDYQTGFITNEKPMHFVDRQEGAKIALAAGQIKEPKDTLYSEDLWLLNGYERKYN